MITEQALQEAIAECQGVRNPDAKTCMMLAAFYTLQDKLFPHSREPEPELYSYDPPPNEVENTITYESNTDFGRLIYGRKQSEILSVVDEAMDAISVLNPSLYGSIIRKIEY